MSQMSEHPDTLTTTPEALKLRGRPPTVTRLSRKVLMGGATLATLAVLGAVTFAMRSGHGRGPATELFATDAKPPTEALAGLPKDYAGIPRGVPKLGPPLPGDLGRPILNAQTAGAADALDHPATKALPPDPARQQRDQERQAARTSRLFAAGDHAGPRQGEGAAASTSGLPVPSPPPKVPAADHKQAFLEGAADDRAASAHRVEASVSPYVVQAGAVVPAALVTGIRSDLPGQVTAQVTENVYDSPTGRILLIPQGARLIGIYDSQVEFGQRRVLLAWTRLILPGGRSIVLERQPAGDSQGYAGLTDGVDRHWAGLASAAAISTVLGIGAQLGSGQQDSDIVRALRQGEATALSQAGQQLVGKSLDVAPTLTIRPGHAVRVIVTRDLILEPARN